MNRKKPTRINVESGKIVLVAHEEKQKSGSQPSPFSHRQARCRRIPQIPQRLPTQRTGFPGEKPSSNRMQVQTGSVRFKKVRTGPTLCRFEPNWPISPNTTKKLDVKTWFGSGSGLGDPPVGYDCTHESLLTPLFVRIPFGKMAPSR